MKLYSGDLHEAKDQLIKDPRCKTNGHLVKAIPIQAEMNKLRRNADGTLKDRILPSTRIALNVRQNKLDTIFSSTVDELYGY